MIALIGITIDRNVTSRSRNAMVSTKPNTSGACDARLSLPSTVCGGGAVDEHRDAADRADGAGDDSLRSFFTADCDSSFWPSPTIGTDSTRTLPSWLVSVVNGSTA